MDLRFTNEAFIETSGHVKQICGAERRARTNPIANTHGPLPEGIECIFSPFITPSEIIYFHRARHTELVNTVSNNYRRWKSIAEII